MRAAIITGAIGGAFALGMLAGNTMAFQPRLVGLGCQGTSNAIFAMEESDFPPSCLAIEPARYIFSGEEEGF